MDSEIPEGFSELEDILDTIKETMQDQTYINAMSSLSSILDNYRLVVASKSISPAQMTRKIFKLY
jgi:hypothetical protein